MLIVQNNGNQGNITIKATSDGLRAADATVVAANN
jgi:hypothetical protein